MVVLATKKRDLRLARANLNGEISCRNDMNRVSVCVLDGYGTVQWVN